MLFNETLLCYNVILDWICMLIEGPVRDEQKPTTVNNSLASIIVLLLGTILQSYCKSNWKHDANYLLVYWTLHSSCEYIANLSTVQLQNIYIF